MRFFSDRNCFSINLHLQLIVLAGMVDCDTEDKGGHSLHTASVSRNLDLVRAVVDFSTQQRFEEIEQSRTHRALGTGALGFERGATWVQLTPI